MCCVSHDRVKSRARKITRYPNLPPTPTPPHTKNKKRQQAEAPATTCVCARKDTILTKNAYYTLTLIHTRDARAVRLESAGENNPSTTNPPPHARPLKRPRGRATQARAQLQRAPKDIRTNKLFGVQSMIQHLTTHPRNTRWDTVPRPAADSRHYNNNSTFLTKFFLVHSTSR